MQTLNTRQSISSGGGCRLGLVAADSLGPVAASSSWVALCAGSVVPDHGGGQLEQRGAPGTEPLELGHVETVLWRLLVSTSQLQTWGSEHAGMSAP
jgi:hypothetical protein